MGQIEKEEKFILRPVISPRDKDFRNKIGNETWIKIKSKAFRDDGFKCQGCGFEPYDVPVETVLDVHLISEDKENPENSEVRTTCMLCHIIEHADVAVEHGYVELVNSHFTQGELVNISGRQGGLSNYIENGSIRYLKKTLQEYLEELKSGRALEGKVKLIFTQKYLNTLT